MANFLLRVIMVVATYVFFLNYGLTPGLIVLTVLFVMFSLLGV